MGWRTDLKIDLGIRNKTVRQLFAEFLGTFVFVTLSDGAQAQFILGERTSGFHSHHQVAAGVGVAATLGVFVAGGISGGHLNPAITVSHALLGRVPWCRALVLVLAQFLAGFVAAACVLAVYWDSVEQVSGGDRGVPGMAAIWASYPQSGVSTWTGLGESVLAASLLVISTLAVCDHRNTQCSHGIKAMVLGSVRYGLQLSFGLNCGNPVNPARDLGPRMLSSVAGWGMKPFRFREFNWFWVPVVGPLGGALIGTLVYQLLVGMHHSPTEGELSRYRSRGDLEEQASPEWFQPVGVVRDITGETGHVRLERPETIQSGFKYRLK